MMRTNLGLILAAVMTAGSNIAKDIRSLAPSIESVAGEPRYQPSRTVQIGGDSWHPTTRGPSWTVAQVKRMARKQRNRKQHRAACRRSGGRKS